MASLPRVALSVKEGLTGVTAPTFNEVVHKETKTKGHPLFWRETLDVEWFLAFFKDSHVTHVFDVIPVSGTAACAAAILNISYEGLAMSAKHSDWLDNIMDKAIFAVMRLREIPQSAASGAISKSDLEARELQESVVEYFKDLIEDGRKFAERVDDCGDDDAIESDAEWSESKVCDSQRRHLWAQSAAHCQPAACIQFSLQKFAILSQQPAAPFVSAASGAICRCKFLVTDCSGR